MSDFCLEVRGDYACFTRPELKVERVSYDVITPSAARSIFEAILWKPGLVWQVTQIEVLEPIRWISVRRNEVGSKLSTRTVEATMRRGAGHLAQYVDDDRQQRAGLLLRDVAYRLHASLLVTDAAWPGDSKEKFAAMFRRRASRGQCINQPYLGTREFACRFRLVEDPASERAPLEESRDLGLMLYDLDFANSKGPTPLFFHARLENGLVAVPSRESAEVLS